jgi:hypothetical protein
VMRISTKCLQGRIRRVFSWVTQNVNKWGSQRKGKLYFRDSTLRTASAHLSVTPSFKLIWYGMIWYDTIYLLTEIELPPGGSSTVHIYTQTIHRTTQNKQYIEQHKNFGRVRAVPRLCELCPGICLTPEEKARKNLSQCSVHVFE